MTVADRLLIGSDRLTSLLPTVYPLLWMMKDLTNRIQSAFLSLVLVVVVTGMAMAQTLETGNWSQWGGPDRNFAAPAGNLAETWPPEGPPVLWSRPLGLGHSSIVVDDGMLYTLYRPGTEISRSGPWEPREFVVAIDAETGETIWEHEYASEPLNFSYGAGPHATPLVVGDRVFTAGTNKQIFAFDKATGEVLWSHDLVRDFDAPPTLIRPAVKAGFASSPVAYDGTFILQVGGEGQAVMAFDQATGEPVWSSGDFLVAQAAPLLIDVDGQEQVVIFGGQTVNGLNPATGEVLWSHGHDTNGDMNNSMPVWGPDNILFLSSAYDQGSRALHLTRSGHETTVEELWFSNRFGLMFSNAIRLGDHIYGTDGDFGPAFMAAVDVTDGVIAWQQRGFGRSSLIYADDKAIIIDEDGRLVLARLSPDGMTVLAESQIFHTQSWTVPTLVGATLYARDREKIVALDLGE
jgi:outer membrane protein assembly factor BamB